MKFGNILFARRHNVHFTRKYVTDNNPSDSKQQISNSEAQSSPTRKWFLRIPDNCYLLTTKGSLCCIFFQHLWWKSQSLHLLKRKPEWQRSTKPKISVPSNAERMSSRYLRKTVLKVTSRCCYLIFLNFRNCPQHQLLLLWGQSYNPVLETEGWK